jgi:hypothetical protein
VTTMIAQPPADTGAGRAAMYHYTWGADYLNRANEKVPPSQPSTL